MNGDADDGVVYGDDGEKSSGDGGFYGDDV